MSSGEGVDNRFEVVEVTPWSELEEMLREVPLLGQPDTRPYADAEMSIERFRLSQLASTTRYILEDLLGVQRNLRAALLPQGYDQLDLRAGRLILSGPDDRVRIMPPIVERYEPFGQANYVIDGSHRVQLAREIGEQEGIDDPELTVIYVRNGIAYPPYALPNPWKEVRVVSERPADQSKWKNYIPTFERRYGGYRDYNNIIDSVPRGLDEPTATS